MKSTNISISFEDEKLSAVQRYMKKKNTDLEEELSAQLEKLYQKYVPAGVQEYIAERDSEDAPAPSARKNRNGGEQ